MAFCTNCGMELEEGAKFCAQCGKATNEKNQPIGQRINVYDGEIHKSSNIDFKLYGMGDKGVLTASQREISDAWLAKFEQAYEKAKLVLTGEDFNNINNIYVKTLQKLRKEKLKLPLLIAGCIIGPVLIIVFCLIMAQFE